MHFISSCTTLIIIKLLVSRTSSSRKITFIIAVSTLTGANTVMDDYNDSKCCTLK
jgi:hypothetical protein